MYTKGTVPFVYKEETTFRSPQLYSTRSFCRNECCVCNILNEGIKQLISKVGSGSTAGNDSVIMEFTELLTDFRGH